MSRRRLPKSFRPAESESLIAAAVVPRDKIIVLLGLYAGLRVSEILDLEVTDIDLVGEMVMVNRGKGDKDRVVPLAKRLAGPLREWISGRQSGWLFPSPRKPGQRLSARAVQRMIKRIAKLAGILDTNSRRSTPHKLRHSFATSLLRSGADLAEISAMMGHSSVAVTSLYLSADPQRMQLAVDRLNFGATTPEKPDPTPEPPEEPKPSC